MANSTYKIVIKKGSYTAQGFGPGIDLETALINFMLNKGLATNPSGDGCTLVCCGGGGGAIGGTNLDYTRNSTSVTVISDTGTDTVLPFATETQAGVMTADMVVLLNSLGEPTNSPNRLAYFDGAGALDAYDNSYADGTSLFLRVPDIVRTSGLNPYTTDFPLILRHDGAGYITDIRFAYQGIDIYSSFISAVASTQSAGIIFQQTYTSAGTTIRTPLVGDFMARITSRITKHKTAPYDPYLDSSSTYLITSEVSSINGGTNEVGTSTKLYTRKNTDPSNINAGGNAFLIGDENGDIALPYYPQGRNDAGDPVNVLSTDVNGKVLSQPANLFAWKALDEIITGNWTFNNNIVIPVTPTSPDHATSKAYVDGLAFGLVKHFADLATTANITLSGEQTIDGVLTSGARVLVHNQTAQEENGIWETSGGPWSRVTDMNTAAEVNLALVVILFGTTHANTFWTTAMDIVTIDVDDQIWVQVNSPITIVAGGGLTLTGMTLDVVTASVSRIVINANSIDLAITAVTPGAYGTGVLIPSFTVDAYGRLTAAGTNAVSIANNTLDQLSDVIVPTPTTGDVLSWNGVNWVNTPLSTTPNEGYIKNFAGSSLDLDANVGNVKDVDDNNIAFTLPTDLKKFHIMRNGLHLDRGGALDPRDYQLNTGTNTVTFTSSVNATETLYVYKLG